MLSQHDWPWRRVTGVLGIVFFVGMAIGFAIFGPLQPDADAPIAELRDFYVNDDTAIHTASWIVTVSILFAFLPFAAGLRSVLAEHDLDAGMWTRTSFGAAVATVSVGGAGSALIPSTMLALETDDLDDSVLRLMAYADAYVFTVVLTSGMALFLVTTSIVVLRTGALWKWLGWLGLLIAALALVGAWWPVDGDPGGVLAGVGFTAVPLWLIWILLVGINLVRAPATTPAVSTA